MKKRAAAAAPEDCFLNMRANQHYMEDFSAFSIFTLITWIEFLSA
jgi:hypothetical protein